MSHTQGDAGSASVNHTDIWKFHSRQGRHCFARIAVADSYLQGLAVHLLAGLLHVGQHDVLRGLREGVSRVLFVCALAVLRLGVL